MHGFDKAYEINLQSLYQATILMLFNKGDSIEKETFLELTGMNAREIDRVLKQFLDIKLLTNENDGSISINMAFKRFQRLIYSSHTVS